MSGPTPGPWEHAGGGLIVVKDAHPVTCIADVRVYADARLIAAAPDLLAALYAVRLHLMVRPCARLPDADENVKAIVVAAIAIAKAEGKP